MLVEKWIPGGIPKVNVATRFVGFLLQQNAARFGHWHGKCLSSLQNLRNIVVEISPKDFFPVCVSYLKTVAFNVCEKSSHSPSQIYCPILKISLAQDRENVVWGSNRPGLKKVLKAQTVVAKASQMSTTDNLAVCYQKCDEQTHQEMHMQISELGS